MQLDLDRTRADVEKATTEDLLDRTTIYRAGMEPEALALIDDELHRRGALPEDVAAHAEWRRKAAIWDEDGLAVKCEKCARPAVVTSRGWHRLWGLVPVFPRTFALCAEHRPGGDPPPS